MLSLLTDSEADLLLEGATRTLDRAGVLVQDRTLLQALLRQGARVDIASERAWIPPNLLSHVVELQNRFPEEQRTLKNGLPRPCLPSVGVSVAQFIYDLDQAKARLPTREDFLDVLRFQDVYHPEAGASHALLLRDVPPRLESIEAVGLILQHARHPGVSYVHYGEQVPFLGEIGDLWFGDRKHFLRSGIYASTPLRFDRRACGVIQSLIGEGIKPGIGTMVVSGASAPVTPAGAAVVGLAEILAGWTLLYALEVSPPYTGGSASGSMNMKSTAVSFGSPEAMLQDLMLRDLARKSLGGHINISGGANYTDAKHPGMQAAYERYFEAHWICLGTGSTPPVGSGLIDSGKTLSLEQFILDDEVAKMHQRVVEGVEINEELLGLNEIEKVGPGLSSSHMETGHCLRHCRDSWESRLFDDSATPEGDQRRNEEAVLRRARQCVEEALSRYSPPEHPQEKISQLKDILDHARRNLG